MKLSILSKITLISYVTPVFFNIGSLLMSPTRVLFLVMVPVLLINLFRGKYGPIILNDIMMLAYASWLTLSIFINNPDVAVTFTGSNLIYILGGYFVARATIKNINDFMAFIKFLTLIVLILLPFGIYESITSNFIIPKIIENIPSLFSVTDVNYQRRLGFDRAQVVFSHPIHFGLFCSLSFALYFTTFTNSINFFNRSFVAIIIACTCFLSVSSGPFLSLLFQGVLIFYGLITRGNKNQWKILIITIIVMYMIAEFATNRVAIYSLASKLSFTPHTANVRAVLFEYGIAQIPRAPIFGVGYNDWGLPWWMSGSIDNFWLLLAIVHGIPAFIFLFTVFVNSVFRAGRGQIERNTDLYYARIAWTFVLISLMLTLATVAIWTEMLSMVMFVLGSGSFFFALKREELDKEKDAPPSTSPSASLKPLIGQQSRAKGILSSYTDGR